MKSSIWCWLVFLSACHCQHWQRRTSSPEQTAIIDAVKGYQINRALVQEILTRLTARPHPLGSPEQREITQYIHQKITELGGTPSFQTFDAITPNPAALAGNAPVNPTIKLTGQNVVARVAREPNSNCFIGLASHYDTKIVPGIEYVGANDSGSSSALLIDLFRFLSTSNSAVRLTCNFLFVWFDGEEAILSNWNDGEGLHPARIIDHTYGSRYFVSQLKGCDRSASSKDFCLSGEQQATALRGMIVLDMIGSPDLVLSLEQNSTASLKTLLKNTALALGLGNIINPLPQPIQDDHIPFLEKGIPAIDLIDFTHLGHWHKETDKMQYISIDSMEKAGRLALGLALSMSHDLQGF